MFNNNMVESSNTNYAIEILETYSIHPRLKDKITRIAIKKINELHLFTFDEQYQYIDWLITKFKNRLANKHLHQLSLDTQLSRDSETTFHDVVGIEDPDLEKLLGPEPKGLLPVYEIPRILRGYISKFTLKILRQLLHPISDKKVSTGHVLNTSRDEIIKNANKIQERLEQLAQLYGEGGKIVIPRRPIACVDFNPLSIRFKCRKYNGDPLSFFREHQRVYKGMSRTQLSKFDKGLYGALRKAGQLHEAVPKPDPDFPSEDLSVDVEVLRDGIAKKLSLEELARRVSRSQAKVVSKLRSLSKAYPRLWRPEIVAEYVDEWIPAHYKVRVNPIGILNMPIMGRLSNPK